MKDLIKMSYDIRQREPDKHDEVFTEEMLKELLRMGGAAVAPHLKCTFDVLNDAYEIRLVFPTRLMEERSEKKDGD